MSDLGRVQFELRGAVALVTFDRPATRNAMTWSMYGALKAICSDLHRRSDVRAVIFRGAGGEAFVSGTDISQFAKFEQAEDGVRYEALIDVHVHAVESLPMPTIAVVEGLAIGGGLAIAAACDFRICTPGTRFGLPIAKTVGNCLSMANTARLANLLGVSNLKKMLLAARLLSAEELLPTGFIEAIVPKADITNAADQLSDRLARLAPITQRVSKQAIERWMRANCDESLDLVRDAYGSNDFHEGVAAFMEKRPPVWKGK